MVQEKRIVFEVGDIIRVRVQCTKCKGEVTCLLSGKHTISVECPHCQRSWRQSSGSLESETVRVLKNLLMQDKSPVQLSFEINQESKSSP